jgi:alanine racemase
MNSRPCWVEISTGAFEHNYQILAEACGGNAGSSTALRATEDDKLTKEDSHANDSAIASPVELLAIVKANAYGHGVALCAPAAMRAGARWLGVTSVEEGVAARSVCPDAKILVIGGVFPGQGAEVVRAGITAVVWAPSQLDELEDAARKARCKPGAVAVHL